MGGDSKTNLNFFKSQQKNIFSLLWKIFLLKVPNVAKPAKPKFSPQ
jgi:hypothetical protein